MSMLRDGADVTIGAYRWVPEFAQGFVRDLRPRWACEEAGIPYREKLADVTAKPDWLKAAQPWSQVPVLYDGNVTLFESGAALLHLAERSEHLLPRDPQGRATAVSWLFSAFNTIEPSIFEHGNVTQFAKDEEWAKLRRPGLEQWIGKRLAPLEERLLSRDWLGEAFSVADIAMVTTLRPLRGTDMLAAKPAVAAYVQRGTTRPAFRQAMADQLAAFARHPDNKP